MGWNFVGAGYATTGSNLFHLSNPLNLINLIYQ